MSSGAAIIGVKHCKQGHSQSVAMMSFDTSC